MNPWEVCTKTWIFFIKKSCLNFGFYPMSIDCLQLKVHRHWWNLATLYIYIYIHSKSQISKFTLLVQWWCLFMWGAHFCINTMWSKWVPIFIGAYYHDFTVVHETIVTSMCLLVLAFPQLTIPLMNFCACGMTLTALSNTSFTPSCVSAEHSRYLTAPITLCILSPSEYEMGVHFSFARSSIVLGSSRRSRCVPTRMIGTFGQKCLTSGCHYRRQWNTQCWNVNLYMYQIIKIVILTRQSQHHVIGNWLLESIIILLHLVEAMVPKRQLETALTCFYRDLLKVTSVKLVLVPAQWGTVTKTMTKQERFCELIGAQT